MEYVISIIVGIIIGYIMRRLIVKEVGLVSNRMEKNLLEINRGINGIYSILENCDIKREDWK